MKKINIKFISIVLAIFSFALLSCDDEDTTKENSFRYDGKTYKIDKGLLENWGLPEAKKEVLAYSLDLSLITNDYTLNEFTGEITGTGSYLYVWFLSTSETQLTPGTYTYNDTDGTAGTFYYGEIGINILFFAEVGYIEIVAGTIKVKLDGTKYEIDIDCTLSNNKKITGYYKGNLIYIDQSATKSTIEKHLK